jgi:hypothetical protein
MKFETEMRVNIDSDLQERIRNYVSWRQLLLRQQLTAEDEQERLEGFLPWLLDARWFPETDHDELKRRKSELKSLRAILRRMETFSKGKPIVRLQESVAKWQDYERTLAQLVKQHVRRAPNMQTCPVDKAETEIAERLLCATLIIPKLWPGAGIYRKMQKFLAEPKSLPRLPTAAEDNTKELRTADGKPARSALQAYFTETGKEMPLKPHSKTEKTLQSCVRRLEKKIEAGLHFSRSQLLESLYGQYLWSLYGQSGFSDAEARMLRSLVPPEPGPDGYGTG